MLFAHDFRAPERLFAQLMQVAGRAGRHGGGGEVLIQTGYPEQPVYQALLRHDYAGFARHALEERETTGLPPFAYQRSEEHTSELQSLMRISYAVFCLQKKNNNHPTIPQTQ